MFLKLIEQKHPQITNLKEAIFRERESQQEKESDIEESEEEGEFWFHFQGFVDFVFFVPCYRLARF